MEYIDLYQSAMLQSVQISSIASTIKSTKYFVPNTYILLDEHFREYNTIIVIGLFDFLPTVEWTIRYSFIDDEDKKVEDALRELI